MIDILISKFFFVFSNDIFSDPNVKSDNADENVLDFKWEPASQTDDYYLRIAMPECCLKKELKNGRLKELRKIFGNSRIVV